MSIRVPKSLDTRRIRRVSSRGDDRHFAVNRHHEEEGCLCDNCATDKCRFRNYASRTMPEVDMRILSCQMFTPAFNFSIVKGFDQPLWNTIRIGSAWEKRLVPGDRIAAIDTQGDKPKTIGLFRVASIHVSTLEDLVANHARFNHAILAELEEGKIESRDVQERMMRILKNAYGSNFAAPDRQATAVYMDKI